jgi:hypothetical protein
METLPDIWDTDEKTKEAAHNKLQYFMKDYGITDTEWKVLAEDTESVDRLKAILVFEHNKVSNESGKTSRYQQLQHIRMRLQDEADQLGIEFEKLKLEEITKKRIGELVTWCGLKKTMVTSRVRLALLSEKNFSLLMEVMDAFRENRLKGQSKLKKKAKDSGDDQEDKVQPPEMPSGGIDNLVNSVEEDGITKVLQDLIAGRMALKDVNKWVNMFLGKKRKLIFFLFRVSLWLC